MPGKHDEEKFKFIGLWVHNGLVARINAVRGETGVSQFLRDAVADKLKAKTGEVVPREIVASPDRAGKGGPKRQARFETSPGMLNEPASSPTTLPNQKAVSAAGHTSYTKQAGRSNRRRKAASKSPPAPGGVPPASAH